MSNVPFFNTPIVPIVGKMLLFGDVLIEFGWYTWPFEQINELDSL